jgi:hypothetical protein
VVGHVHEAFAEGVSLRTLFHAHTLLQFLHHRTDVFEERRSVYHFEHATHRQQREPLALGDRNSRVGLLAVKTRVRSMLAVADLDLEARVLKLGEVAHRSLAMPFAYSMQIGLAEQRRKVGNCEN